MRSLSIYIVPNDILESDMFRTIPRPEWHAESIPGDPTKSLLTVQWGEGHCHPAREGELESMPGVLPLGYPWEPLPAEAVPLLASFQDPLAASATAIALPAVPPAPDSLGRALHKIGRKIF